MPKLKEKESVIFDLLDNSDIIASAAFEKLYERFYDDDAMGGTAKSVLLKAIYINRYDDSALWKLAVKANISDRTLYSYRHMYILWFYYYYTKLSSGTLVAA